MQLSFGQTGKLTSPHSKKQGYISNLKLILFAFSTAFYSRIFCSITHAPSILNFAHFGTVSLALGVALGTTKTKDRKQIATARSLLSGILALLGAMLISAVVNNAGLVNVVFDFLILGEPYMFLLVIVCIHLLPTSIKQIRSWVLISALINFLLAEIQKPLLEMGIINTGGGGKDATDGVQGVFFVSGAGCYVSSGISFIVALYFLLYFRKVPIWIRVLGLIGSIHHILISDSKTVILVAMLAWLILVLSKVKNFKKMLLYITGLVIAISAFVWAAYNIEGFESYRYWFGRTDIYLDINGDGGLAVKLTGIRMVLSYYQSPLNWLFGLGPGHTLGRLGGFTINDYWNILSPLGATKHPLYDEIWKFINGNWIALTTTLFVPLFTWAGIWGDLGWFGIGVYLYLGTVVWCRLCVNDFAKFLVLNVVIFGFFLTQMEEPGYMLFIAILIALMWHEKRQNLSICF